MTPNRRDRAQGQLRWTPHSPNDEIDGPWDTSTHSPSKAALMSPEAVLDINHPTRPHSPTAASRPIAASARNARRTYRSGDTDVHALAGVDVDFSEGAFTAIMGPSGSGKSTLMHCLAGLDTLTSGVVSIGGTELGGLSEKQLTRLRRDRIGFVFQAFNLIPTLTVAENVSLPAALAGTKPDPVWLKTVIDTVGLGDRLHHRPDELSGGQRQRVAVARALATQPSVIFADEPTGNLDSRTGSEILTFMRDAVREMGQTIVMVTHDPIAASYADRAVFLVDGLITSELEAPTADSVLSHMKTMGA